MRKTQIAIFITVDASKADLLMDEINYEIDLLGAKVDNLVVQTFDVTAEASLESETAVKN